MSTVTLVARETFTYDGVTRYAGHPFEALTPQDAKVLTSIGKAYQQIELSPEPLEQASGTTETPRIARATPRRRQTPVTE